MTNAELAEKLYHHWRRAQHDITEHPAWGNLPAEDRLAWEAVAAKARELLPPITMPKAPEPVTIEADVHFTGPEAAAILASVREGQKAMTDDARALAGILRKRAGERVANELDARSRSGFEFDMMDEETRGAIVDAIIVATLGSW